MFGFKAPKNPIIYDDKQLFRYGINRLSERDFCREELRKKMSRYQSDSQMLETVLNLLEEKDYLSDYRRARGIYVQYCAKESINKIKNRILQKGVTKIALETLLDEIKEKAETLKEEQEEAGLEPESMELENAQELLVSKFKVFDKDKKDKMIRFLASKGYKYNDISRAIKHFSNPDIE